MAYTDIDDPSAYFQTVLYTGNGGTQSITNTGNSDLQPNWIWTKVRSEAGSHRLVDTVRGLAKPIFSNGTDAEADETNYSAFDSDGFSLVNESLNENTRTYVAWQWKAGTSFTNDASATGIGSIDSTGSVNTDAGFSIVSYTGTGSNATVGHGLSSAPKMIIVKDRSAAKNWTVYHIGVGNDKDILLDVTNAENTSTAWNNTTPTSSVFSIGTLGNVNTSSNNYIAYCFAEKKGYSKFGSYTGNGSTDGTFVYTGFKPAFILIKPTDIVGNWPLWDNKLRPANNVGNNFLYADLNNAQDSSNGFDMLSNGFKNRTSSNLINGSGNNYIYMAFAENPFVTSTGIPTTAR